MHRWSVIASKKKYLSWIVHIALLGAVTAVTGANGQQTSAQSKKPSYAADPASLPIAISRVESGDFHLLDIEIIARWHAVQAIPALETQFERSKDSDTKAKIANALERLGEKNGPYWDFLVGYARQVLQDVPPTPVEYNASGVAIAEPSKKFIDWANEHHMSVQQASSRVMVEVNGVITDLGSSDDDRAIPILREALASQNDFVKAEAARGLAELHDTESVSEIIEACGNAPKEAAASIAASLVYFDDPAAQRALDEYVPESTAQELRRPAPMERLLIDDPINFRVALSASSKWAKPRSFPQLVARAKLPPPSDVQTAAWPLFVVSHDGFQCGEWDADGSLKSRLYGGSAGQKDELLRSRSSQVASGRGA